MTEERGSTDDGLMLGVRRGETQLFAELFRRHRTGVFNYLWRMTGDHHSAEELTQETFLAALRARENYRAQGKFNGWLYSIATNLARNDLARGSRRRVEFATDDTEPSAGGDGGTDPVEKLTTDERARAVREALMRLTLEERSVVVLRHYHGMRFAQIAETLAVPEGTAKSRMRYALEKLRRYLEPGMGKA